jgi:hypothetical protein
LSRAQPVLAVTSFSGFTLAFNAIAGIFFPIKKHPTGSGNLLGL